MYIYQSKEQKAYGLLMENIDFYALCSLLCCERKLQLCFGNGKHMEYKKKALDGLHWCQKNCSFL